MRRLYALEYIEVYLLLKKYVVTKLIARHIEVRSYFPCTLLSVHHVNKCFMWTLWVISDIDIWASSENILVRWTVTERKKNWLILYLNLKWRGFVWQILIKFKFVLRLLELTFDTKYYLNTSTNLEAETRIDRTFHRAFAFLILRKTDQFVLTANLYTCIRKVPGLKLGRHNVYPGLCFCDFSQK
jgi:hypothetical protein